MINFTSQTRVKATPLQTVCPLNTNLDESRSSKIIIFSTWKWTREKPTYKVCFTSRNNRIILKGGRGGGMALFVRAAFTVIIVRMECGFPFLFSFKPFKMQTRKDLGHRISVSPISRSIAINRASKMVSNVYIRERSLRKKFNACARVHFPFETFC